MALLSFVAFQAAVDGNLRLLKKLDLRVATDARGKNVLHFAASKGRLEIVKYLVEELGLDVNSRSIHDETPMLFAAQNGSVPVLKYLIDHGGDPACTDSSGSTPLHYAAEHGQCEALRLLLSRGVPVDPLDLHGAPLHKAASKSQDEAVKILLEHGADPNRVFNHIFSPLMKAICGQSLKCVKLLVEAGADVNIRRPSGPSILIEAVDDGLTDIVKFLLEAGADPNVIDEDGRTPIMFAAARGRRELVEILFPWTKPIPSIPGWSVDGIIRTMKWWRFLPQDTVLVEQQIADAKSQGKEAFAKGEYYTALHFYGLARDKNPLDATLFSNMSLCWLRLRDGDQALLDARRCKMMRPRWSKAWYREGAALSMLKKYKGAVDAFLEALKLHPANDEIKEALREAIEAMKTAALFKEQNP
ncbi:hypothetical protein ACP4OV_022917 [Aristida adscensionis]